MAEKGERLYRELAARYVEEYGRRLEQERTQLEAQNPAVPLRLEQQVRRAVGGEKARRRRLWATAAALAACLLLMVAAPTLLDLNRQSTASSEAAGGAEEGDAAPADGAEEEGGADSEAPAETGHEMIRLDLTLPTYLSVPEVEQDNEKTVYYLDNQRLDHVVLSVEYATEPLDHSQMTRRSINGQTAWSRSEAEYHLLTVEADGIIYILSCRYELDTLLELAEYIL